MAIDEVMEKCSTKFPNPLTPRQMQEFLQYAAINLSAEISYDIHDEISLRVTKQTQIPEKVHEKVSIDGRISLPGKGMLDRFKIEHRDCVPTYLDTFCFEPIPGYDLDEHRPEIVQLWGIIKELVSHYQPLTA